MATQPETPPTRAELPSYAMPAMKTFSGAPGTAILRPNSEIGRDFMDLAFQMESGRALTLLTRFEGPITVRVNGQAPASLGPDLQALLARLRNEAGIDIRQTAGPAASLTVQAVPRAELQRAVPGAACFVIPRVTSWNEFLTHRGTARVEWSTLTARETAAIFVPSDVAPQEIRDCLHEELAQALGPLNDLYRLPDSVFNDDNMNTVLTGFDMLVLRAYYAPELHNGMSRAEVAARLPAVLARLNPAGQRPGGRSPAPESPAWKSAIETALTNGQSQAARQAAAARAVALAGQNGWSDSRLGFSYYVLGRLLVATEPERAQGAFNAAQRLFDGSAETRLQAAHVAVQQAAFALHDGDGAATLAIVDAALPAARAHENAALMATLMMFRAEALALMGRGAEAEAVRLDSLGWARYGFGNPVLVQARLNEIAALSPQHEG